jgi:LacI family transcriptional regulator, gluconate utilization system Gnt-I transcriptional repressor
MATALSGTRRRMEDVARRAGVSQMTVSRALRTPDKVAPGTRARIVAAVAELDYVPDLVAGGLAAKRSRLVAVIVSTLENSIFAAMVEGLTRVLRDEGYAVLLGASGYSRDTEEELIRAALGRRPDGLVLTGDLHTPVARRLLQVSGIPVVETWELPEAPLDLAVGFSNHQAGAAMVHTLYGCGYRRIAFVGTAAEDDRRGRLRREGYRAMLAELGAGPPRELTLPVTVAGITDGPVALDALLATHPDTDAAFCVVDGLAAGVILACRRCGVDVPGRLAVAGFGDFDLAQPTGLDITTVRVSGLEIGNFAGTLLLTRLRGERVARAVHDVGFSIIRRSSA